MTTLDTSWQTTDVVYSNGDLTATQTPNAGTERVIRASTGHTSGKFYFEATYSDLGGSDQGKIGLIKSTLANTINLGYDVGSWSYVSLVGSNIKQVWQDAYYGSSSAYKKNVENLYTAGQVVGLAVDFTSGKIWWSRLGTWVLSGNPENGTNPAFTFTPSGTVYAAANLVYSSAITFNFGATAFTYPMPGGYYSYDGTQYTAPPEPIVSSYRNIRTVQGRVPVAYRRL